MNREKQIRNILFLQAAERLQPEGRNVRMEGQEVLDPALFRIRAEAYDHPDPVRKRNRKQVQKIHAAGKLFQAV